MGIECGCGLGTSLTCPECGGKVVLVNSQATCLECGATLPPSVYSSVHDEAHHHGRIGHPHEEKAGLDDLTKLRVLLPHWIEHNNEHAESFRHWAARVQEMGRAEIAQQIEEAVERIAVCNQALDAALKSLEAM